MNDRVIGKGEFRRKEGEKIQTEMIPVLTAVISGVSAGAAAILVAVIQSRTQHNKTLAEWDKRDALQAQRIDQLEKKMDKHNQLVERTYAVEKKIELIEKDVKVANHRIDDLEHA